ncbi:hypothetical protein Ancab_035387 [Ancistrocladus abbreviatus]
MEMEINRSLPENRGRKRSPERGGNRRFIRGRQGRLRLPPMQLTVKCDNRRRQWQKLLS